MIPRCTVGKGITGAVRYILGEGRDPESGKVRPLPKTGNSRVAWFGGTGFGFEVLTPDDADLARRMMEFDAQSQTSKTRRCDKDCLHLSLGWRPGETPTIAQMQQAANAALAAIGMEGARALFAIHSDENYAHIHVVASKINPETGRAYDLKSNYLKLSKWAEQYEREFSGGVICTQRAENNELRDAIAKRNARAVLDLITKQRSTFTERDLDYFIRKEIPKIAERASFAKQILAEREVVALSDEPGGEITRFTTETVLEAEGHVLRAASGLQRSRRHGLSDRALARLRQADRYATLTDEQLAALRHATMSGGLALIDGKAGTGKSFTMAAIRTAYEDAGCRVIGLAPTNAVAQDMLRDGFQQARTIHSELFALNTNRAAWSRQTVVMVDEAAMVDTRLMAMLTAHAYHSGAKLILIGDDRQLSSIDRGGMFSALKERYGAARLSVVRRQGRKDDRRATELMAEGNFYDALAHYDAKGAIHWTASDDEARSRLVRRWAEDSRADPAKSRFVFAYTNEEVDRLNHDLRQVRESRGELGKAHRFATKHGVSAFAVGDRLQFTGTDKRLGIVNGHAGVIQRISNGVMTVRLDGDKPREIVVDTECFIDFRLGYAGTIYKGQGRTLDQTYLFHTSHWRSAASYVALSRHRDKTELFVSRETARDLIQLARQMGRVEERRAASQFFREGELPGPVRPLTPLELAAALDRTAADREHRQDRVRTAFRRTAQEETERCSGKAGQRRKGKEKQKGKGSPHPRLLVPPVSDEGGDLPAAGNMATGPVSSNRRLKLLDLFRRASAWLTRVTAPLRPGRARRRRPDGPRL